MKLLRPILSLLSLFFLAGAILLQFLTILSGGGGKNSSPENRFYFLEASNIGNIPNARNPSRWTFWSICGVDPSSGHNTNCGSPVPALPFDPPRNFGTTENVPTQFVGTKHFYYMSRFMFAFYIISLFFAVIALFLGLAALFSRLAGYLSGLTTFVALFFQVITASLMTAWTVEGRNHFRTNGQSARLGVKLYAFTWTVVALFFLSSVLFVLSGFLSKDRTPRASGAAGGVPVGAAEPGVPPPPRERTGFFSRKTMRPSKEGKERGSFLSEGSSAGAAPRKSKDDFAP